MTEFITATEKEFGVKSAPNDMVIMERPPLFVDESIKGKRYITLPEITGNGQSFLKLLEMDN
jgi:hypothetical protein